MVLAHYNFLSRLGFSYEREEGNFQEGCLEYSEERGEKGFDVDDDVVRSGFSGTYLTIGGRKVDTCVCRT